MKMHNIVKSPQSEQGGFLQLWIANVRVNCENFAWQSSSHYQKSSQKNYVIRKVSDNETHI